MKFECQSCIKPYLYADFIQHSEKCSNTNQFTCPLSCNTHDDVSTRSALENHLQNSCSAILATCLLCKAVFSRGAGHACEVNQIACQVYQLNLSLAQEMSQQDDAILKLDSKRIDTTAYMQSKIDKLEDKLMKKDDTYDCLLEKMSSQDLLLQKMHTFESKISAQGKELADLRKQKQKLLKMISESTKKKCEKEQAEIEFDKDYFQEPESKKKKNRKGKEEI